MKKTCITRDVFNVISDAGIPIEGFCVLKGDWNVANGEMQIAINDACASIGVVAPSFAECQAKENEKITDRIRGFLAGEFIGLSA